MKIITPLFLLLCIYTTERCYSQNDSIAIQQNAAHVDSLFKATESLTKQKEFSGTLENRINNGSKVKKSKKLIYNSYTRAISSIKDTLFKMEKTTEFIPGVSEPVQRVIATKKDLYNLVTLKREIHEDTNSNNSDFMKVKLIETIDARINRLCINNYPYYTYRTNKARYIKFVSISTGNDLFTPAGIAATFGDLDIKNSNWYFQRNDDRDYTGSLMIEIGTDYFRFPRRRNLKTYQTIFYGFDVFTPYFKDTVIFAKSDTFNVNDRPHASFQYFGWSKKGISRNDKYRWSVTFKFGLIGGDNGRNFQAALHQDISYSPRPKGWDAQISNRGRMGFSAEATHEYNIFSTCPKNPNSLLKFNLQALVEGKLGSYMTNASLGLQISNKNLKQCNHNFIHHRVKQNVISWFDNLMYSVAFVTTAVKHNTMLQGYGVLDTKEYRDDALTPGSRHKLTRDKVRPFYHTVSATVSYTARYFTLFYKWMSISPETTIDDTQAHRAYYDKNKKQTVLTTETMKIGNRWHHFAIIGISFNIKD